MGNASIKQSELDQYCTLLGVNMPITEREVKKARNRILNTLHPDKQEVHGATSDTESKETIHAAETIINVVKGKVNILHDTGHSYSHNGSGYQHNNSRNNTHSKKTNTNGSDNYAKKRKEQENLMKEYELMQELMEDLNQVDFGDSVFARQIFNSFENKFTVEELIKTFKDIKRNYFPEDKEEDEIVNFSSATQAMNYLKKDINTQAINYIAENGSLKAIYATLSILKEHRFRIIHDDDLELLMKNLSEKEYNAEVSLNILKYVKNEFMIKDVLSRKISMYISNNGSFDDIYNAMKLRLDGSDIFMLCSNIIFKDNNDEKLVLNILELMLEKISHKDIGLNNICLFIKNTGNKSLINKAINIIGDQIYGDKKILIEILKY